MKKNNQQKHQQYPFERFASVRTYTSFNFLKTDPSWVIYIADTSGQYNLWRQRVDLSPINGEKYASHQLTNFIDEAVRRAFPSPKDNSMILFADHQGTENFQIYRIDDAFNSWPDRVTKNPNVRHEWGAECFSHDGQCIAYGSNEVDPSNMLVYVKKIEANIDDTDDPEAYCLTNEPGWYIPGYWSPDNKNMNCSQLVSLTDYSVWLLDVEDRKMISIHPSKEKSRFIVGPWSNNGQGFYLLSDLGREYLGLAFYDNGKSKVEWVLTPEHDIESFDLSEDGKILAWTENVDGYSRLYIKDLKNEETREVHYGLPDDKKKGVIEDVKLSTPAGKKIGIMMTTPTSPSDIYVMELNDRNNENEHKIIKLSNSLTGNIPYNMLVNPELIKYTSFDGLEISAYLYKPNTVDSSFDKKKNKKLGAILSIHGGPTAQERPLYDYAGLYQYLANNGIAIIAPNFRGSTGYGKSFEKMIYHDWGGNELKDLEYATKWLISQEWVDTNRIGVFGASFGGFATLNSITRLSQYNWKAAVDIVGPSNLVTFSKAVPEHWKRFMAELVGDSENEEEFLMKRSPISHVDNIKTGVTDLLVIQGANDPRVVKNESDQIVETLRNKGMNVEYIVFEDEGHGFTKYSNLVKALKKSAEFIVGKLSSSP
ncbi:MAG: prolyl oligopeptidase family serine peptidase [Nitrososphaeraceae archaeon]